MLADKFLDLEQNNYSLARKDNSTDLSKNKISANSHQKVRRLKLLKLYCPFQPNNNFRRILSYSVY